MAILGAQLVFSLIVFSFLQKLSCFYSLGRWLLAGRLVRYLHPSDEELRKAAGIAPSGSNKSNSKSRRNNAKKGTLLKDADETFTIPCNTPMQLDTAPVHAIDLVHLHYYSEYLWIVDFSLSAVVVYVLTEVYYLFRDTNEMNISILWCLLAVAFCVRVLISMTADYFKAEDGGERILIFTFGFFCLVLSMGILVVDESVLEFGLEAGYENFSSGAVKLLKVQGIESAGPVEFLTFKIILAFFCAFIGALMTFPGLRTAKLYIDALKYSRETRFKQVLLHLNFALPYVMLLLWIKPLARDILCGLNWKIKTKVFTEPVFENVRISMFVVLCILRLALLPTHMQSHLNTAHTKIESLNKESGRVSNGDVKKLVARVFYFIIVVAVQYVVPVFVLLFLAFMYKTLGQFSWSGIFGERAEQFAMSFQWSALVAVQKPANASETLVETVSEFTLVFSDLRAVFTPVFYKGLLSFLTWWTCMSWTLAMTFGLYYHTRVDN